MSSSKSTFKKRVVSSDRVAAAESVAAHAPIVGDPRLVVPASSLPVAAAAEVGSIQDAAAGTPLFVQGQARVGFVYDVPLNLITSNPMPPRAVYTVDAVDDMSRELEKDGQITPATGYLNESGGVTIIDGETRFRGARSGGRPSLRIEIREKPDSDRTLYERARAANVERNEQTPLDDALRWRDMLGKGVYSSQAEIARVFGIGEDVVSRTIKLAEMPQKVIHAVAEWPDLVNLRMLGALREFWAVKGDEETLELILEVAKSGLGYRDVMARRKAAEKGPVTRPRSTRETVAFRGAKGEIKSFEKDGRLELVVKGLPDGDLGELIAKIRALFPKAEEGAES